MNKIKVDRYTPELDWGDCYYECDSLYVDMVESSHGSYVSYEDYERLHQELEVLKKQING